VVDDNDGIATPEFTSCGDDQRDSRARGVKSKEGWSNAYALWSGVVYSDDMIDLFDSIDRRFRSRGIELLESFVSIRSLSPAFDPLWREHGEISRALDLFGTWASTLEIPGLRWRRSDISGRTPALVVEIPPSSQRESSGGVLIYGHLDKQPASAPWHEDTDPFVATRSGDLLYGRGVVDDGYSLPCALLALESLAQAGLEYPRTTVIIEASEESGSPDLDAHIDALMSLLGDVELVICLDSGGLDDRRLWVTTSLRGNLVLTVDVEVLQHGVHSGSAGGVVPSSFRIMRQILDRLEDSTTGEVIPDFLRPSIPSSVLEHALELANDLDDPLARAFPIVDGLVLDGSSGEERIVRQTWGPSVAYTGVDGMPPLKDGGNVLRPHTTVKISLRLPPTIEAASAQESLVDLLSSDPPSGSRVTVRAETPANGWVAPPFSRLVAGALEEGSRAGFHELPGFCGEGGSIPFLSTLVDRFPHAQVVATGALIPGSNAHGPDESLQISTAVGVCTAVAHLLHALGNQPG
jgi:acetylornithine deacetylase/succinyl-diaminopimelate desuccinylase-like protein